MIHRRTLPAPGLTAWLLTPCLALLCSVFAVAQDPPAPGETANPRPFFWRIDGKTPSYLFGTLHLPDERVTDVHPDVERALGACDAVFTELEMDKMLSPVLLRAMRLPTGTTLRDVMPAELLQRVCKRFGIAEGAESPLLGMRPWVLSFQALLQHKAKGGEALDLQIYKDAKSAGKEVGGLETVAEQVAVFEDFGLAGEVALLQVTLDLLDDYERRGLDVREQMIQAYCAGDTQRTLAFFEELNGTGDVWTELSRTMMTDRNLRMAERIDRKLHGQAERSFVFAVGAGHLIGATSVVDLLRARGYTVTRVPETAANLDEEIEQLQAEVAQRQERLRQLQARRAALPAPRRKAG